MIKILNGAEVITLKQEGTCCNLTGFYTNVPQIMQILLAISAANSKAIVTCVGNDDGWFVRVTWHEEDTSNDEAIARELQ